VVQSWSSAAPKALRNEHPRRKVHQETGTRTRKVAIHGHDCRMGARLRVRVHSEAVGLSDVDLQDTMVVGASYLEVTVPTEDQKVRMKVVARASLSRVFEVHLLVYGTNAAMVPKFGLNDDLENEVLTWEEMDSPVVQAW
jgi:hypothetical protein